MELSQLMGWVGFLTGLLIGLPQLIKTIKTKRTGDLSAATFALILITAFCFFVRAVAINELSLIVYYAFVICSCLLQLLLIWKYKDGDMKAKVTPGE
ncbi:MAG: hypothetical protein KDI79_12275 [Anaerolineae bacterium]|nr:hypothetical protein [Anaerolineae bacterium]